MAPLPSDLAKVDPADAWKPWRPEKPADWNRKWVSHLYRRAAFGPTPADTERALAEGYEKTLDRLLTGSPDAAELMDLFHETGQFYRDQLPLRVWWLYVMLESGHPLREKMTLFWHNHFATSHSKVRVTRLMFEQNVTLRKHALGKFRPFLLDMSKDTAMLVWLDSNRNVKGAPNENYAREVMELFSLGVGNYTEKDIQEAARALTGWHHSGGWDYDPRTASDQLTFYFNAEEHDEGSKTIFGQTGKFGGADVVKLCCDQPACAKFLVGKLYNFLVSETPPPKGLLAPLEERFRQTDYDIADIVKAMIGSRLFFSEHAYRKRVKWPVEYALGAVRAVVPGRVPLADLADPLSKMGQVLFAPPNVKGWRTGTDWLNSATLLARNNFAETLAMGTWARSSARVATGNAFAAVPPKAAVAAELVPYPMEATAAVAGGAVAAAVPAVFPTTSSPDGMTTLLVFDGSKPPAPAGPPPAPEAKLDVATVLFETKPATVPALVGRMGDVLFGGDVPASARGKIEKYLLDGKPSATAKDMEAAAFRTRAREALHAMMCLPEYQLC